MDEILALASQHVTGQNIGDSSRPFFFFFFFFLTFQIYIAAAYLLVSMIPLRSVGCGKWSKQANQRYSTKSFWMHGDDSSDEDI